MCDICGKINKTVQVDCCNKKVCTTCINFCNHSSKCKKTICDKCKLWCEEQCGDVACIDCKNDYKNCNKCNMKVCCSKICDTCENIYCVECMYICDDCVLHISDFHERTYNCKICAEKCMSCKEPVCNGCDIICRKCDKLWCRNCLKLSINDKYICDDCIRDDDNNNIDE